MDQIDEQLNNRPDEYGQPDDGLYQHNSSLTDEIVQRGRDAMGRLRRGYDDWMAIAEAVEVGPHRKYASGVAVSRIPEGDYIAEIVEVEIYPPKSGDGYMLTLTWRICEGEYENRQVWQSLCYQHSSAQTQDIARKRIKDICVALDIKEQVTDPQIFKFKPARVRVGDAIRIARSRSLA